MRIDLQPLSNEETMDVVTNLPLDEPYDTEAMQTAVKLSGGSPGRALELLESSGAKSFAAFLNLTSYAPETLVEFGNRFTAKSTSSDDFDIFCELLEGWVGNRARQQALHGKGRNLAEIFSAIGHSIRQTNALNLDRRQTVIHALSLIDDALRMA